METKILKENVWCGVINLIILYNLYVVIIGQSVQMKLTFARCVLRRCLGNLK